MAEGITSSVKNVGSGGGGGSGTVTSVGLTGSPILSITGSPVTTAGDIDLQFASETENTVLSGPTTAPAAAPTFRALVAADIPNLNASKITAGTLPVARGGTNSGTALNSNRVMISSSGAVVENAALTAGRIVFTDSNGLPVVTGAGISTAFGASDPIIFGVNSLNFRCPGAGGVDALGIGSAGDVLFGASGRKVSPDAGGTNIDLGATGTRFQNLYIKGAIFITAGANQICGTATLAAGTVTVTNSRVTASSLIFAICNAPAGVQGILSVDASKIVVGTSFVIDSSNVADTSTVRWMFIN